MKNLLAGDIHRQQELSGDKKPRHLRTSGHKKPHDIYKNDKIAFLRGPLRKNEELF